MEQKIIKLQQARLRAKEKGFTLVELAIVLVIIGLIIGGVLVGQDLIKAAEIRATIAQIEQYNAAVNTFRTRFNGIPGDLRNATSFFDASWANLINGNGNRQLEQCVTGSMSNGLCGTRAAAGTYEAVGGTTATYTTVFGGEIVQFWHHLTAAELIGGSFNGIGNGGTDGGVQTLSFPTSKLDRNGIGVYAANGKNYYQIGLTSATGATYDALPSLTPEEAFNIDSKVDDGKPASGSVELRSSQTGAQMGSPLVAADAAYVTASSPVACINEAGLTFPPTTASQISAVRNATYALSNKDVACTIRLRMN